MLKELKKMKLEEIVERYGFKVSQGEGELKYSKLSFNGKYVSVERHRNRYEGNKLQWTFYVLEKHICEVGLTKAQAKNLLIQFIGEELGVGK